jgi:hypothetical protein
MPARGALVACLTGLVTLTSTRIYDQHYSTYTRVPGSVSIHILRTLVLDYRELLAYWFILYHPPSHRRHHHHKSRGQNFGDWVAAVGGGGGQRRQRWWGGGQGGSQGGCFDAVAEAGDGGGGISYFYTEFWDPPCARRRTISAMPLANTKVSIRIVPVKNYV